MWQVKVVQLWQLARFFMSCYLHMLHPIRKPGQGCDHIQSIYEAREWPAEKKLPKLTLKDIKKPGKAAELDVKAAQCRHFVPVVAILTEKRVSKLELQGKKQSTMSQNIVQKCMLPWKLETAWP